jgi:hypothetical protein
VVALFSNRHLDSCLGERRIQSPKVDDSKIISIPDYLALQDPGAVVHNFSVNEEGTFSL